MVSKCWINQPSVYHPGHRWHGTNVLASDPDRDGLVVVYFLSGEVVSMIVSKYWLSKGWKGV